MGARARRIVLGLVIVVAAAAAVAFAVLRERGPDPGLVRTTGTVEAVEVNIASKIAGRILSVAGREGEAVRKGEILVELDSRELTAASARADAAVTVAKAALASGHDAVDSAQAELAVAQAEREGARALLSGAEARLLKAEKDFERVRDLFKQGVDPEADLDTARAERDTRAADVESTRAALASSESALAAANAALKKAHGDIATLEAQIVEADGAAAEAAAKLADTKIYAPSDGVIEYRAHEPGEIVPPGESILTVVDLATLWVRFDLEQRYIENIRVGQSARILLENQPGRVFEGRVMDIGREGEFAVERDVTRGRQDIRTFRTRVRVGDPKGVLKPGMTVLVEIPIEEAADRR